MSYEYTNYVYQALMDYIPGGNKLTPSQWITFNGPCCIHRGQSRADTRKRSGLRHDADEMTSVNCLNCRFKAVYSPGSVFDKKWINYFRWLGMPSEKLTMLEFRVSELRRSMLINGELDESLMVHQMASVKFESRSLPRGAMPITTWLEEEVEDENFYAALQYVMDRGDDVFESADYYWTPNTENDLNKRIIIPFYWEDEMVGWTARLVDNESKARRYHSNVQPHYIFNTEKIKSEWEFVFVTEGPFDGIAVNGVSMLGDKVTPEQAQWLNRTGKIIIVVPDQVQRGGRLVDAAVEHGWYVAFPSWEKGIKDAADAVKKYGKLYSVWSIIDTATRDKLEINVKRQRLQ
jgi:hypothetical protein